MALEDRNDEVPIFYDADRVTVMENSPPGTYVTDTTAIDRDGTSPNNKVSDAAGSGGSGGYLNRVNGQAR